jgi:hypothetical protein
VEVLGEQQQLVLVLVQEQQLLGLGLVRPLVQVQEQQL